MRHEPASSAKGRGASTRTRRRRSRVTRLETPYAERPPWARTAETSPGLETVAAQPPRPPTPPRVVEEGARRLSRVVEEGAQRLSRDPVRPAPTVGTDLGHLTGSRDGCCATSSTTRGGLGRGAELQRCKMCGSPGASVEPVADGLWTTGSPDAQARRRTTGTCGSPTPSSTRRPPTGIGADLRRRASSTESTAPTTTTDIQSIPRSPTVRPALGCGLRVRRTGPRRRRGRMLPPTTNDALLRGHL